MAGIVVDRRGRAAPSPTSTATPSSTSSAASASTRSATRTRGRRRHPGAGRRRSPSAPSRREARVELVERLAAHAPAPGVHRLQLYSSGAEAVESALRLAKCHTGKYEFVSFWGGFHGKTMGALSLMGSTFKDGLGPMVPGSHLDPVRRLLPLPARARVPVAAASPAPRSGASSSRRPPPAPSPPSSSSRMQGTAGNVVPPERLPARRRARIADELGALLIADEMITGFGRTGTLLGRRPHRRRGPTSSRSARPSAAASRCPACSRPTRSPRPSPGASPRARRRATAAIRSAPRRARPRCASSTTSSLVENARVVGAAMLARAPALRRATTRSSATCTGAACSSRVELVRDKKTKEPLSAHGHRAHLRRVRARGLLTMAYARELPHPARAHDRRGDGEERPRHPRRGVRRRGARRVLAAVTPAPDGSTARGAAARGGARVDRSRPVRLVRLRPRARRAGHGRHAGRDPALPARAAARPRRRRRDGRSS